MKRKRKIERTKNRDSLNKPYLYQYLHKCILHMH